MPDSDDTNFLRSSSFHSPFSHKAKDALSKIADDQKKADDLATVLVPILDHLGITPPPAGPSRHIEGPFDRARVMQRARDADEVHGVFSIEGRVELGPGVKSFRCETLSFNDGAHLVISGGRIDNTGDPEADTLIIAAKNLLIRTPNDHATIEFAGTGDLPKPNKARNGTPGDRAQTVGGHGTNGGDGAQGADGTVPGRSIMKQIVLAFDNIETTDPEDPTKEYPRLRIIAEGANGRDGGDGGDGGAGGHGGRGSKSVVAGSLFTVVQCKAGPGKGGNGGNGGDAGNGGHGEDAIQGHNIFLMGTPNGITKASGFLFGTDPGVPGEGGQPGERGARGPKGRRGQVSFPCSDPGSRDGEDGRWGRDGQEGKDGEGGVRGRVYNEYLTQAEFDVMWS